MKLTIALLTVIMPFMTNSCYGQDTCYIHLDLQILDSVNQIAQIDSRLNYEVKKIDSLHTEYDNLFNNLKWKYCTDSTSVKSLLNRADSINKTLNTKIDTISQLLESRIFKQNEVLDSIYLWIQKFTQGDQTGFVIILSTENNNTCPFEESLTNMILARLAKLD